MATVIPQNMAAGAAPIHGFPITPANTPLAQNTLWLYVGVTGNLNVIFAGDTTPVTISNVPVGMYRMCLQQVNTATTAGSLVGFY